MGLEFTGGLFVHCHDSLTVAGSVLVDMGEGLFERVNGLDGQLVIHEFCPETVIGSGLQIGVTTIQGSKGALVGINDDVFLGQRRN